MTKLYVHIPAAIFPHKTDFLIQRRLQPEVACQDADLMRLDFELLADSAARLSESQLRCILHAPFQNFSPGTPGYRAKKVTRGLIESTLRLAHKINAQRIVFHPGLAFNSSQKQQDVWFEQSFNFWVDYIPWAKANNCLFCIENIYESSPWPLLELMEAVNSPFFGHVFDIGHWNIFARQNISLTHWLEHTGKHIKHLHLHDNLGFNDEHLSIGTGTVPFSTIFQWLKDVDHAPTMTIENHDPDSLDRSLTVLKSSLPDI